MEKVKIYDFGRNLIAEIKPKDSSFAFKQVMGEDYVQIDFTETEYVNLPAYCYIVEDGVYYYLPDTPSITKVNSTQYDYQCKFVAPQGLMKNKIFAFMPDSANHPQYNEVKFSLTATAREHLQHLCNNLTEIGIGDWEVGDVVENNVEKTITYDYTNCEDAIGMIAQEYNTEWYVTGTTAMGFKINLKQLSIGEERPLIIRYGKGQGVLPNIKRTLHSQSDKATHIIVQGGERNIQTLSQNEHVPAYTFRSLHLPDLTPAQFNLNYENWDYPEELRPEYNHESFQIHDRLGDTILFDVKNGLFQDEYKAREDDSNTYIQFQKKYSMRVHVDRSKNEVCWIRNLNASPRREVSVDLTGIYPMKEGTVTAVEFDDNGICTIYDNTNTAGTEGVNYSKCWINGEVASIVFQSGMLSGKEFKITTDDNGNLTGYNHETGGFRLLTETFDGISMPNNEEGVNSAYKPAVGDKYAVFHIALPGKYLSNVKIDKPGIVANNYRCQCQGAEWELLRQACYECYKRCRTRYNYTLKLDGGWLLEEASRINSIRCGVWMKFKDSELVQDEPVIKDYYDTWNEMRIISVKRFLNKPNHPEITLGEPEPRGVAATIRKIQTGVAGSTIATAEAKKETEKKIEQSKQETTKKVTEVQQQVQIIQIAQSVGGASGKLPYRFRESDGVVPLTPVENPGLSDGNRTIGISTPINFTMENQTLSEVDNTEMTTLSRVENAGYPHTKWNYFWEYNIAFYSQTFGSRVVVALSEMNKTKSKTLWIYVAFDKKNDDENYRSFMPIISTAEITDAQKTVVHQYFHNVLLFAKWKVHYKSAGYCNFYDEERYYDFTYIPPSQMAVSKIKSENGSTYFDLTNNRIVGELYVRKNGEEINVKDLESSVASIENAEIAALFQ